MSEESLQIFVIDEPSLARKALETQIRMQTRGGLSVRAFQTLEEASSNLAGSVKGIFVDIARFPSDSIVDFVGSIRNAYPWIVFVLWVNPEEYKRALSQLPEEWQRRFGHYFKLTKATGTADFKSNLWRALDLLDFDYSLNVEDPKIHALLADNGNIPNQSGHSFTFSKDVPLAQRVFISYSRDDSEFVDWLWQSLKANSIETWMDRKDIHPGEVWDDKVQEGLTGCGVMLLVLSSASAQSKNAAKEWKYFMSINRPIIPILVEDCTLHFQLVNLQYIDFRQDHSSALSVLVSTIRNHLPSQ